MFHNGQQNHFGHKKYCRKPRRKLKSQDMNKTVERTYDIQFVLKDSICATKGDQQKFYSNNYTAKQPFSVHNSH
jgi:hypothetical protein